MQNRSMLALSKNVSRFLRPTYLGDDRCMSCGYPRTIEVETCSECGWTTRTEPENTGQQRRTIQWMQWSCSAPSIGLLLILLAGLLLKPQFIPDIVYIVVLALFVVGVIVLQVMAARRVCVHTPKLITSPAIMFAGAASMSVFFVWFLWVQSSTIRGVGIAAVVLSAMYLIAVAAAADRITEHRTAAPKFSSQIGIIMVLITGMILLGILSPRFEEIATFWWMILAPGLALTPCQRALNAINGEEYGETDQPSATGRTNSQTSHMDQKLAQP